MERLRLEAFLDYLGEEEEERVTSVVESMAESFPEEKFHDHVQSPMVQQICESYEAFVKEASSKSRTFAFWSMYLKMAGTYAHILL